MSSTGRGGQRSPADFYRTPRWTVNAVLSALRLPEGRWLELGAGEGDIIRAVHARRCDVTWTAVELREECRPSLEATGAEVVISTIKRWTPPAEPFDVLGRRRAPRGRPQAAAAPSPRPAPCRTRVR